MRAKELIYKLRSSGYSIRADGAYISISPAENLSEELVHQLKRTKTKILEILDEEEEAREDRRAHALDMLADSPGVTRVVHTDINTDPNYVILTIAIRGKGVFEMQISKEKYRPFDLLALIKNRGHRVH